MLTDEVLELDVVALAQQLHEPEETGEHSQFQNFLFLFISFLVESSKTSQGTSRRVVEIVAVDRLHDELITAGFDVEDNLSYAGRDLFTQFTDDILDLKEEFVFVILLNLGEDGILALSVSAQREGDPELQDAEDERQVGGSGEGLDDELSHVRISQEGLGLLNVLLAIPFEIDLVPLLDGLEFVWGVVLGDEL